MKGYTKLLGMFIKIINIVLLVLMIFGVFITITDYKVDILLTDQDKALRVLGEAVLSSTCLTVNTDDGLAVKGLLNITKLRSEETATAGTNGNPSCLYYSCPMLLEIETPVGTTPIVIGDRTIKDRPTATWPAALDLGDRVVPTRVKIYVNYNDGCAGACG